MVQVEADGALVLSMNGVVRKRREPGEREPRYVWTNVELNWEEHHYIEARYWPGADRLQVTINGNPLYDDQTGDDQTGDDQG